MKKKKKKNVKRKKLKGYFFQFYKTKNNQNNFEFHRNNTVFSDVIQTKKLFQSFTGYLDGDNMVIKRNID